jgi:hypothetical protein
MERATEDLAALLPSAREALAAGRWEDARDGFEAALKIEESGGAVFGLALAVWWLRHPVSSVQLKERALRCSAGMGTMRTPFLLRCTSASATT